MKRPSGIEEQSVITTSPLDHIKEDTQVVEEVCHDENKTIKVTQNFDKVAGEEDNSNERNKQEDPAPVKSSQHGDHPHPMNKDQSGVIATENSVDNEEHQYFEESNGSQRPPEENLVINHQIAVPEIQNSAQPVEASGGNPPDPTINTNVREMNVDLSSQEIEVPDGEVALESSVSFANLSNSILNPEIAQDSKHTDVGSELASATVRDDNSQNDLPSPPLPLAPDSQPPDGKSIEENTADHMDPSNQDLNEELQMLRTSNEAQLNSEFKDHAGESTDRSPQQRFMDDELDNDKGNATEKDKLAEENVTVEQDIGDQKETELVEARLDSFQAHEIEVLEDNVTPNQMACRNASSGIVLQHSSAVSGSHSIHTQEQNEESHEDIATVHSSHGAVESVEPLLENEAKCPVEGKVHNHENIEYPIDNVSKQTVTLESDSMLKSPTIPIIGTENNTCEQEVCDNKEIFGSAPELPLVLAVNDGGLEKSQGNTAVAFKEQYRPFEKYSTAEGPRIQESNSLPEVENDAAKNNPTVTDHGHITVGPGPLSVQEDQVAQNLEAHGANHSIKTTNDEQEPLFDANQLNCNVSLGSTKVSQQAQLPINLGVGLGKDHIMEQSIADTNVVSFFNDVTSDFHENILVDSIEVHFPQQIQALLNQVELSMNLLIS